MMLSYGDKGECTIRNGSEGWSQSEGVIEAARPPARGGDTYPRRSHVASGTGFGTALHGPILPMYAGMLGR